MCKNHFRFLRGILLKQTFVCFQNCISTENFRVKSEKPPSFGGFRYLCALFSRAKTFFVFLRPKESAYLLYGLCSSLVSLQQLSVRCVIVMCPRNTVGPKHDRSH